jgi:DegV family protein with EDD domain
MGRVRIVTDSAAQFLNDRLVRAHQIEIVPLTIHFGSKALRDNVDISSEEMFYQMRHSGIVPTATGASAEDFARAYSELCKTTDQICVITHSQYLTETYAHAQSARVGYLGRCDIVIVDSQTTGVGQGMLVEAAAEAAWAGALLDEIMRLTRHIVPRLYSIYSVDTLDYIQHAGLIGDAQAILGTMLGIRPLLTIEDGHLIAMEKARTRAKAVEKLAEFVIEFAHIEQIAILQNTPRITEQTRALQDRLATEFPDLEAPMTLYDRLLSTLIGPDAMGVVVYEGMEEETYD